MRGIAGAVCLLTVSSPSVVVGVPSFELKNDVDCELLVDAVSAGEKYDIIGLSPGDREDGN